MKTYTAIEVHELAKHVCSEYWRRAEIPGEQRSIPDLYAEAFGHIILRLQDDILKCRAVLARADSELSAIAHGSPVHREEAKAICWEARRLYEGKQSP